MIVKKSRQIGGKTLSIEVGKLARLAGGSAVVTLGESIVLATVDVAEARPGIDFFPLTVEYREKTYAAGHMMYLHPPSRAAMLGDLAALYGRIAR